MSDTVYRKDVNKTICDFFDGMLETDTFEVKDILNEIDNLPSATPEREKGEWLFVHPLQTSDMGAYMCSQCKKGDFDIEPSSYKFCPYCGAEMKGE